MTTLSTKKLCLECGKRKFLKEFCIFCFQKTTTNISVKIHETMCIRDSIKIRRKRQGFKKFISETLCGWFPSGDKKIIDGVKKTRIINKEKNEYYEKVENYKTGKILRHCTEKLTDHIK